MERLLEYIPCESTTGEASCQHIVESLTGAGLDVCLCRSQTMDYAWNVQHFLPRTRHEQSPTTVLNLVLGKSCKLKEVHVMLETLDII